MADTQTTQVIHAEIPFGQIEYNISFKAPIFEAWRDTTKLIPSVLSALEPFGFKLDGVELKYQPEKLNDRFVIFRRATPGFVFSVGVGRMGFLIENVDWSEAENIVACAAAAMGAVQKISNFEIATQQLTLIMHVQFKEKNRAEITAPLLAPSALKLLDGTVNCHGIILTREKATIVVDGSAAFANGIFVRIVREHSPDRTLAQMAETLRKDEQILFDVLGVTGEL